MTTANGLLYSQSPLSLRVIDIRRCAPGAKLLRALAASFGHTSLRFAPHQRIVSHMDIFRRRGFLLVLPQLCFAVGSHRHGDAQSGDRLGGFRVV